MTNLPTVPSKSSTAENARTDMGNFFQMPSRGIGGNLSNTDFDSFLGNRETNDQAEELREEQEAAKKRRKPVDAGLASPPTQQEVLLQELEGTAPKGNDSKALDAKQAANLEVIFSNQSGKSDLDSDSKAADIQDQEIRSFPEIPESVEPQKTDSSLPAEAFTSEEKAPVAEKENLEAPKTTDPESESRGIESASSDVEMIASAKMESIESPVQPLREPTITTSNRLTAFASLERTAVAPVDGSGNTSESGFGNAANSVAMPAQFAKSQSASPSAQASSLFKSIGTELDKFKQTSSSQIQLDLPVGEDESVRIKLSIRGGEIRSTFITESPELREALQKAWPEFSQNSRDRGFRMGDPAFQQSFQENNANLEQNNRRQSNTGTRDASEIFAPVTTRKPVSKTNPASNANSTALWA